MARPLVSNYQVRIDDGSSVDFQDGSPLGVELGIDDGSSGVKLGIDDGSSDGFEDSSSLGVELDINDGSSDGFEDGPSLGVELGINDGFCIPSESRKIRQHNKLFLEGVPFSEER
jgi:hypothetical protein